MNSNIKEHLDNLNQYFDNKQMLSKSDISKYLNLSLSSVNSLMIDKNNKLNYLKFGSDKRASVRVYTIEFARYLSELENTRDKS